MKLSTWKHRAAACLVLCIGACGGAQSAPEPSGFFATFIEDDGTKKFQYTLDSPFARSRNSPTGTPARPAGHVAGSSSRGVSTGMSMSTSARPAGTGHNRGRDLLDKINQDLDTQLDKSLRESQYCRDGFKEKERVIEQEIIFVRGQCEESASAEDRTRFPN